MKQNKLVLLTLSFISFTASAKPTKESLIETGKNLGIKSRLFFAANDDELIEIIKKDIEDTQKRINLTRESYEQELAILSTIDTSQNDLNALSDDQKNAIINIIAQESVNSYLRNIGFTRARLKFWQNVLAYHRNDTTERQKIKTVSDAIITINTELDASEKECTTLLSEVEYLIAWVKQQYGIEETSGLRKHTVPALMKYSALIKNTGKQLSTTLKNFFS